MDSPKVSFKAIELSNSTQESAEDVLAPAEDESSPLRPSASQTNLSMAEDASSNIYYTIFNFANATVGSTTLGMPVAIAYSGWLVGSLSLLLLSVMNALASIALTRVAVRENVSKYDVAMRSLLGPTLFRTYQLLMMFSTLGSLISSCILIGDFAESVGVMSGLGHIDRRLAIAVVSTGIILPLSLTRSVTSLRFSSTISFGFVALLVAALVYKLATSASASHGPVSPYPRSFMHYMMSLSIMVQGLSSQTSALPVFNEMEPRIRNLKGFSVAAFWTFGVGCFAYCVVGVVGYVMFGPSVKGNVLSEFTGSKDVLMIIVIAGYMFKTVCAYPLTNFPLRVTVHYQLYKDARATMLQHALETVVPFAIAVGLAVLVSNVSILFSFVGSVARTSISFMFPAALMLQSIKVSSANYSESRANEYLWYDKLVYYLMFAIGLFVAIFGLTATIYFMGVDPTSTRVNFTAVMARRATSIVIEADTIDDEAESTPLLQLSDINDKNLQKNVEEATSSLTFSVFNLVNATMGASTLAMPEAIAYSGWLVGSLSLLLLSVMNALSSVALARVAVRENVSKYDEAILSLLGPLPFRVYQFLMIFSTLGSLATAIVLIGDFSVSIGAMSALGHINRRLAIAVVSTGIILPLSLTRSVTSLRFSSTISFGFVALLVAALMYKFFTTARKEEYTGPLSPYPRSFMHYMVSLSIMVQALSCQTFALPVFSEMKPGIRNLKCFSAAASWTFGLVVVVFGTVGSVGYVMFGPKVKGNVLSEFTGSKDVLMIIVIAGYMFKTVCAYPLTNFPLRVTVHYQLYKDARATMLQHALETVVPFVIAVGLAVLVSNVSILFSFVGSVARTSISFMFPAALMLKSISLVSLADPEFSHGVDKTLYGLMFGLGALIAVLGLAATLYFLWVDE